MRFARPPSRQRRRPPSRFRQKTRKNESKSKEIINIPGVKVKTSNSRTSNSRRSITPNMSPGKQRQPKRPQTPKKKNRRPNPHIRPRRPFC